MDRGAWWATVYGVAKSLTRLKHLNSSHVKQKDEVYFSIMYYVS